MVLTREKAIRRLKDGGEMVEDEFGGYQYTIDFDTIRFETARKLINEGLVVAKPKSRLLSLTRFIWKR